MITGLFSSVYFRTKIFVAKNILIVSKAWLTGKNESELWGAPYLSSDNDLIMYIKKNILIKGLLYLSRQAERVSPPAGRGWIYATYRPQSVGAKKIKKDPA